ncbi:MAG: 23S rRNA (guanosine(2251)-2'-O)-methyltransferase RlmB [Chlamydiota bacterium]
MKWRLIMGKNCLREVVRQLPYQLIEVYTSAKKDPLLDEIDRAGIPIFSTSKKKLSALVQSESHQSFVAKVRISHLPSLKQWVAELGPKSLVILCDSLADPHNLGAILRAAECFGAAGVVYSKNRSVAITPVVSKVSVGASELVPTFAIANLAEAVRMLQQADFTIVAAQRSQKATSLFTWTFADHSALILGAEGVGIQPLLRRLADHHLEIPLAGQIDSLNVSQAAAVFLAHWSQQVHQC